LGNSNISTIPDYAFSERHILSDYTNIIKTLSLDNNPLESISDLAFANLPQLTILSMENSSLVNIPTIAINAVPSLTYVELRKNLITEIGPDSFVGLQNLRALSLQGNPIIAIQPGAFNGLLWFSLDIYDYPNLTSVDAAITYGMNKVNDLKISNCPNFEEITLNNCTQLPESLGLISATNLNVKTVSSNFDFWLQLSFGKVLDISDNYNYNCTPDISWMSKYVFCPDVQIVMVNTTCADTNQLVKDYLQQLVPIPTCNQHTVSTTLVSTTLQNAGPSSAILMENSSIFFVLCTLLLLFCFFT
jgi:Leucine-rich repeat (LRR) protein